MVVRDFWKDLNVSCNKNWNFNPAGKVIFLGSSLPVCLLTGTAKDMS